MIRGTTPTNIFNTDISLADAEVIHITYQQGCKKVIQITDLDRMTVTDESISVTLTQHETLALKDASQVRIQIRAKFPDGTAVACKVITASVGEILEEGVI